MPDITIPNISATHKFNYVVINGSMPTISSGTIESAKIFYTYGIADNISVPTINSRYIAIDANRCASGKKFEVVSFIPQTWKNLKYILYVLIKSDTTTKVYTSNLISYSRQSPFSTPTISNSILSNRTIDGTYDASYLNDDGKSVVSTSSGVYLIHFKNGDRVYAQNLLGTNLTKSGKYSINMSNYGNIQIGDVLYTALVDTGRGNTGSMSLSNPLHINELGKIYIYSASAKKWKPCTGNLYARISNRYRRSGLSIYRQNTWKSIYAPNTNGKSVFSKISTHTVVENKTVNSGVSVVYQTPTRHALSNGANYIQVQVDPYGMITGIYNKVLNDIEIPNGGIMLVAYKDTDSYKFLSTYAKLGRFVKLLDNYVVITRNDDRYSCYTNSGRLANRLVKYDQTNDTTDVSADGVVIKVRRSNNIIEQVVSQQAMSIKPTATFYYITGHGEAAKWLSKYATKTKSVYEFELHTDTDGRTIGDDYNRGIIKII